MTTLGIIADIHGNAAALAAVVDALKGDVDHWVCAGDIAGHLPMVSETIAILRAIHAKNVQGNHDAALLAGLAVPESSAATRSLQIQRRALSTEDRQYLQSCPHVLDLEHDGIALRVMHGGPHDTLHEKVRTVDDDIAAAASGRVLVLGHIHRPFVWVAPGHAVLNPGAVGLPVDGERRATAMLLRLPERWVQLVQVPYDPAPVLRALALQGYDKRYARCLRAGRWPRRSGTAQRRPIIVAGASVYGRAVAELVLSRDDARLVGFVDDTPELHGHSVGGHPVLGPLAELGSIAADSGVADVAVAVGDNEPRRRVAAKVREQGVRLATLIHASAIVSPSAKLGPGVIVDAGSFVGPGCVLEEGVSVWPTVLVAHDTVVGAYASLKPGVTVGGCSRIAPGTKVALGSVWPGHSVIE